MEVIREKIKEAAVNAGLAKEVEIHVPLGVRADALTRNLIDRVIVAMKAAQTGNMHVELGPATASVIWRDIPVFSSPSDLLQYGLPTENFSAVIFQNSAVTTAASSKVVPILGPNVEELFVSQFETQSMESASSSLSMLPRS